MNVMLGAQLEFALQYVAPADSELSVAAVQLKLVLDLSRLACAITNVDLGKPLADFLDLQVIAALGCTAQEAAEDLTPAQMLEHVRRVQAEAPQKFANVLQRLQNKRLREQQAGSSLASGSGTAGAAAQQQPQRPQQVPHAPAVAPALSQPASLVNPAGFNSKRPRLCGEGASPGRASPGRDAPPPPVQQPEHGQCVQQPAHSLPGRPGPAPEHDEHAYACALEAACKATPELSEPLAWALLTLAEMLARNTKDRGGAPSPADTPEELRQAVELLARMGRHRLPAGRQLAQLAVDAMASAWLDGEHVVPYCSELAGDAAPAAAAPPPFSLLHTVQCFAARLPPTLRALPTAPPHPDRPPPGVALFTLAPSLLGRYRQLNSCDRFLHLKTEFSQRHNVNDGCGEGRTSAAALLKDGNAAEAILQKGMHFEVMLTELIGKAPAPACLAPTARPPPATPVLVRDLALEAFCAAAAINGGGCCACGHTEGSRLGPDLREKRHYPSCQYHEQLFQISRLALLNEQPGVCLYQAKFLVPPELYRKCGLNADVLRFTAFQPDYVYVMHGEQPGTRELAIVDAKASAHVKVAHRVQVAAYAWALDGLLAEDQAAKSRVADVGAIWRPGCDAPDVFALAEPVRQHEEALRGPLSQKVLTLGAYATSLKGGAASLAHGQDWQLRSSCASCEYVAQCRAQADSPRPLTALPGVNAAAAVALCELADIEDGTVPALAAWLRSPAAPTTVEAAANHPERRRGVAALAALAPAGMADAEPEASLPQRLRHAALDAASSCAFSPRLAAALDGKPVVRPGAICTTLPAPPGPGDRPLDIVCVSLLNDPTTGEAYAWAVQTFTAQPGRGLLTGGSATPPAMAVAPRSDFDAATAYAPPPPAAELEAQAAAAVAEARSFDATLSRGLALRRGLVAELHTALCGPGDHRACAVLLDGNERASLLGLLFAVATSGLAAEADIRVAAQCCLFACLDCRLLAAEQAVGLDADADVAGWPRFRQLHAADSPSLAALLPALPALLELPALGFVTLADVARHVAVAAPAFGDDADALRDFILGPDAPFGRNDSLEATVEAFEADAAYRDWSARAVGGELRVAELVARRCRLAAATMDGLRTLLDAAGGARQFLPLRAPKRGAALQVQPFESAACARAALFKCLELRAAGAAARAERARPLATRLRKGKTLLLRVTGLQQDGASVVLLTCSVVPEADGGAPDTAREALLNRDSVAMRKWLLAPLNRAGLLSSLRFPDAAVAHAIGEGVELWSAFPPEAHALRASLCLGAPSVLPRNADAPPDTLTLRIELARNDDPRRFTALDPETHCRVGAQLLLFERESDPLGPRVAAHARALVDCPRGGPAVWLRDLPFFSEVVACNVVLDNGVPAGTCVAHFLHWESRTRAEMQALPDGDEAGDAEGAPADMTRMAMLLVTASDTVKLAAPMQTRVRATQITHRFSLYRTLFDPGAAPGVPLPPYDPAVGSPAGAWACGADAATLQPMKSWVSVADPLAAVNNIYKTHFTPTSSQAESFSRVVEHRMSAVWGPPGSGKTHFSAGLLLALFIAHGRAARPLRVLVCAFTKAATRVLLRKLADEMLKLTRNGFPPTIELYTTDKEGVDLTSPLRIQGAPNAARLWQQTRCVVGATVWQANKLYAGAGKAKASKASAAPKFDLLLVDEASQLLACDAMMAVDLLDPFHGRLVVVGDHLQLPPVIRGAGYPAGTAGCPSPAASLLSAVQGALKAGGPAAAAHAESCTLLDNHRMAEHLARFCAAPEGIYPAGFVQCSAAGCPCRGSGRALPLAAGADAALQHSAPWLRRALNPAAELVVIRLPGADDAQEAAAASALLRAASTHWAHPDGFCADAFVVSPHHRQIALLRGALAADERMARMSISTVETVQGREAELVLILYGLSCPDTIAAEADFLYSLERLNVALTRARQKAVLFVTRAVTSPDARAAAAAASPTVDAGLAFLRRAASYSRCRGWYIRLRHRPQAGAAADGGGSFEVDTSPDSDDEGASAAPPPCWPAREAGECGLHVDDSEEDGGAGSTGLARADSGEDESMTEDPSAEKVSQDLAQGVERQVSLAQEGHQLHASLLPPAPSPPGSLGTTGAAFGAGNASFESPQPQQPRRGSVAGRASAPPKTASLPDSQGTESSPLPVLPALPHTTGHHGARAATAEKPVPARRRGLFAVAPPSPPPDEEEEEGYW